MSRTLKAILTTVIVAVLAISGISVVPSDVVPAQAANAWDYNAGYIISDAKFYDSNSMNAAEVQQFLNAHVPNCQPWRDSNPTAVTCLKDYSTQTVAKNADSYCAGYAPGRQTAAQIIDGVARSCGISQKVLLVMLEKENALVTHTWPSAWRFRTAMGYGCPDGAPCDSQYYGLFNQVFRAAWQYKYYAAHPGGYAYRAGQNNFVPWNPNSSCGGSTVYIQNQATASLYIYTPYQPNTAAKNAGYGKGDPCSSYGNRNFFMWYSDWFGSPTGPATRGAIGATYTRLGGSRSFLGDATTAEYRLQRAGGAVQYFEHGQIHWSPESGAHATQNGAAVQNLWAAKGWENGPFGYPISEEIKLKNGVYQTFQGVKIHWSPSTGAHATGNGSGIQNLWATKGWENGPLGYPISEEIPTSSGALQRFVGGTITWDRRTGAARVTLS